MTDRCMGGSHHWFDPYEVTKAATCDCGAVTTRSVADERSVMVLELTNLICRRMNDGGRDISTTAIEAAADDIVQAGWRPTKPHIFMREAGQ